MLLIHKYYCLNYWTVYKLYITCYGSAFLNLYLFYWPPTSVTWRHIPDDIQKFLEMEIANCKNGYERCVASVPGEIWSRGLESFTITLYNSSSVNFKFH